jgi:hypothetical protein
MSTSLLVVYLLILLPKAIATSLVEEPSIDDIDISSLGDPLFIEDEKQDLIFYDTTMTEDFLLSSENLDTPWEISNDNPALLDSEVSQIESYNIPLDVYDNFEGIVIGGPESQNTDQAFGFEDDYGGIATSCQPDGDVTHWFINNDSSSTLMSRNLIDDYFDLRIPDEILSPKKSCPVRPWEEKPRRPTPPEPVGLPFRWPNPDWEGKRCKRLGLGSPVYALCCFGPDSGRDNSQGNICYPGKSRVFLNLSSVTSLGP